MVGWSASCKSCGFHRIEPGSCPSTQRQETRLLAHGPHLELLYGKGRKRGPAWLAKHAGASGVRSSTDGAHRFG